jgi:uncharacterized protein YndB with AHSA1/START domain
VNRFLPVFAAAFSLAAGIAVAQTALPATTPDVVDTSFATADGARDLQQSVVIEAPVEVLWQAFVDPKQFARWNSPVAAIDLRVGGSLEASYDPKKPIGDPDNIKHRLITFLPNRLLVFQNIQAPHELPHADLFQRTVTVVQYEVLGPSRTRVTLSSTGWAGDPVSAQLYGFFQKDNAEILEKMKQVYEGKP